MFEQDSHIVGTESIIARDPTPQTGAASWLQASVASWRTVIPHLFVAIATVHFAREFHKP